MNVREHIRNFLMNKGCKIKGEAGIWYITTPDGEKWDMTIPFSKDEQQIMMPGPKPYNARDLAIEKKIQESKKRVIPYLDQLKSVSATYTHPEVNDEIVDRCPHCGSELLDTGKDREGYIRCPRCKAVFREVPVYCGECRWRGLETQLDDVLPRIPDLGHRVAAGDEVPIGSCPLCGGLAYVSHSQNPVLPHVDHVDNLEVFSWLKDGEPVVVRVDCARCGCAVVELYNADVDAKDQEDGGIRDPDTSQEIS